MYHSNFAPDMENMVASLRNAGLQMAYINFFLTDFDNFCMDSFPDAVVLTPEIAQAWIHSAVSESTTHMARRVRTMKYIGKYQQSLGKTSYIPDCIIKCPPPEEPRLFSDEQLAEFFQTVDTAVVATKTFPYNDIVLPVLFRLVYCCGLRTSEACNLTVDDVDLARGTLTIYRSKGFKDRLLFMSDDVFSLCLGFDDLYHRILPGRTGFFQPSTDRIFYKNFNISKFFDALIKKTSFCGAPGKKFTAHGLRHLFAVQNIRKCAESGEDFMNWIQYLCKYMGHKNICSTMYYLHMTSQLFPVYSGKLRLLEEGIGVAYVEE